MRTSFVAAAAAVAALLTVPAAHAGGFIAPVVEIEPVVVVEPIADWQGGYAGVTLGYAFAGDDDIGFNPPGVNVGSAELSGANAGLRLGYRWQRDRWVFGPEISYDGADINDSFTYQGIKFESEADKMVAVRFKTGYLVRPDTMVYGIAGWQKGEFTYDYGSVKGDYDADGYVLGLGVERLLTERMSITGEYEYSDFGRTNVEVLPGVNSVATPVYSNVKVGLNFSF